jgi:hypothetical protein
VSTRYADANAAFAQERYMSDPAFTELRGVSGAFVAARAAIMRDESQRELIWWMQATQLEDLAVELISTFPERVQRIDKQKDQAARLAAQARRLAVIYAGMQAVEQARPSSNDLVLSEENLRRSIAGFLLDMCVNPAIQIEAANACPMFNRIADSLRAVKKRREEQAKAGFVLTESGRKVWQAFDFARANNALVLVDGREGIGKTEATEAYLRCHLGQARSVSVKGISNRNILFRDIAKALGLAASPCLKSREMQVPVEETLKRSKLLLIIDEAHHLFPRASRIYSRPELVDWAWTLSNHGVPVALVTTPQFLSFVKESVVQVGWNWNQFKRRIKLYQSLARDTSKADMERVAQALLPGLASEGIKKVIAYAMLSQRDLSGLGDIAREAKTRAAERESNRVTVADVDAAMAELMKSDKVFASVDQEIAARVNRRGRRQAGAVAPSSKATDLIIKSPAADRNGSDSVKFHQAGNRDAGGAVLAELQSTSI